MQIAEVRDVRLPSGLEVPVERFDDEAVPAGCAKRQATVHVGFLAGASRRLWPDHGQRSWSHDKTPAGEVRERPNRTHC